MPGMCTDQRVFHMCVMHLFGVRYRAVHVLNCSALMQASAATQQAQSDALQARSGLLDEEQVALIAEIEVRSTLYTSALCDLPS